MKFLRTSIAGAIGGVQPKDDNSHDFFYIRTLGENLADVVSQSLKIRLFRSIQILLEEVDGALQKLVTE